MICKLCSSSQSSLGQGLRKRHLDPRVQKCKAQRGKRLMDSMRNLMAPSLNALRGQSKDRIPWGGGGLF
jgi:hypothetical protein